MDDTEHEPRIQIQNSTVLSRFEFEIINIFSIQCTIDMKTKVLQYEHRFHSIYVQVRKRATKKLLLQRFGCHASTFRLIKGKIEFAISFSEVKFLDF